MTDTHRFRITSGKHVEGTEPNLRTYVARDQKGQLREGFSDIIETDKPLDELFGTDKFRRLSEETETLEPEEAPSPQETSDGGLDEYTLAELKELAGEENIDLGGATKKVDVLVVMERHYQGAE